MNVIITMAGQGQRFREAGYEVPKYQIKVRGKTLFEWAVESLLDYLPHTETFIFVVRQQRDAELFIRNKCLNYDIRNVKIVSVDYLTKGQAATAMLAMPYCRPEIPVLFYNIDTYVEPGGLKFEDIQGEGFIPCFIAEGTHWSFVSLDEEGFAKEIREKEKISDLCTIGAYYFSSAALYQESYRECYSAGNGSKEEYIAPLYNYIVRQGKKVAVSMVDAKKVHVLGTPEELALFRSR